MNGILLQVNIPDLLSGAARKVYETSQKDKSDVLWIPKRLPEEDVSNFGQVAIAVGLMARCVKDSLSASSPYLIARTAGRDATQTLAHNIIHRNNYVLGDAVGDLVQRGLSTKRNLLESFDENDMSFFQAGLHETFRDLKKVQQEWVRTKSKINTLLTVNT